MWPLKKYLFPGKVISKFLNNSQQAVQRIHKAAEEGKRKCLKMSENETKYQLLDRRNQYSILIMTPQV